MAHPFAHGRSRLRHVVWVKPVRELRSLALVWPLPDVPLPDYKRPTRLLAHLLGHEGTGSVLALLKAKGWAEALSASGSVMRHFSLFSVDIALTPEGLQHVAEVVQTVYRYAALLRAADDAELTRICGELAQVAANAVRFQTKVPPVSAVQGVAGSLQLYPARDVLVGPQLMPEFAAAEFRAALATLHPANMLAVITAKEDTSGAEFAGVGGVGCAYAAAAGRTPAAGAGKSLQQLRAPSTASCCPVTEAAYASEIIAEIERYYGTPYKVAPLKAQHLALWGAPAESLQESHTGDGSAGSPGVEDPQTKLASAADAAFLAGLTSTEAGMAALAQARLNGWVIAPLLLPAPTLKGPKTPALQVDTYVAAEASALHAASSILASHNATASSTLAVAAQAALDADSPASAASSSSGSGPRRRAIAAATRADGISPMQTPSSASVVAGGATAVVASDASVSGAGPALSLPAPNPFIPSDFSLHPEAPWRSVVASARRVRFGLEATDGTVDATVTKDAPAPAISSSSGSEAAVVAESGPVDSVLATPTTAGSEVVPLPVHPLDCPLTDDAAFAFPGTVSASAASGPAESLPSVAKPLQYAVKFPVPVFLPPSMLPAAIVGGDQAAGILPALATTEAAGTSSTSAATGPLPRTRGIWVRQGRFGFPRTNATLEYDLPAGLALAEPTNRVAACASLAASMAADVLTESLMYEARAAGVGGGIGFSEERNALTLDAHGYSHKLPQLLAALRSFVTHGFLATPLPVLRAVFERCKDADERALASWTKAQPYEYASMLIDEATQSRHVAPPQRLAVLQRLQLEDVLCFWRALLQPAAEVDACGRNQCGSLVEASAIAEGGATRTAAVRPPRRLSDASSDTQALRLRRAFVYGNTGVDSAVQLVSGADNAPSSPSSPVAWTFATATSSDTACSRSGMAADAEPVLALPQLPGPRRGLLLCAGSDLTITRVHPNPAEPNACATVLYQLGAATPRTLALASLLEKLVAEPAFTALRTKEQLGYLVASGVRSVGSGVCLQVRVQSANSSAAHLERRIHAFVEGAFLGSGGLLETLPAEQYASVASILAYQYLRPDKSPAQEYQRLQQAVQSDAFEFHFAEAIAAAVSAVTKNDLLAFARATMLPGAPLLRRLAVRVVAGAKPPAAAEAAAVASVAEADVLGSSVSLGSAAGALKATAAPLVVNDGGPAAFPDAPAMVREWHISRQQLLQRTRCPAFVRAAVDAAAAIEAAVEATAEPAHSSLEDSATATAGADAAGADDCIGTWLPTAPELCRLEK
jgi:hypothetical protein